MAARWFKASKDGTSFRFVPRFAPLEDRCVPATYYVDPRFVGKGGAADGAAVIFDQGYANETTGLRFANSAAVAIANPTFTAFESFRTALDAAELNPGPDTIRLATGLIDLNNTAVTLDLGGGKGFVNSVPVSQVLTLRGDGAGATVVTPLAGTQYDGGTGAVPDGTTSLFRVDGAAAVLTASGFRLDGNSRDIGSGFAVQNQASAAFDGVTVSGIAYLAGGSTGSTGSIPGAAVVGTDAKSLTFANGTLSNYGRNGILFSNTPGSVTNSSVLGRGPGRSINNAIELQSGAVVSVTGNRIADNATVSGPIQSVGLLVADDGAGANPSKALAVGNTFTGNAVAINYGASTPDTSTVDAAYNTFAGNAIGVDFTQALNPVDLANNWWGSPTGPFVTIQGVPVGTGKGDVVAFGTTKLSAPALTVAPFLSYPTPQLSPADVSSFVAAQADYLRLITTLGVAVNPVGPASLTVAPASVSFAVTVPVPVAANTVAPAALRPLQASDFVVTGPTGFTTALTGSGTSYTLTVSGLTGTNYAVTAMLPARAAIDPATGYLTAASNAATVTVAVPIAASNAAPTITAVPDQTLSPTGATAALPFTVGDDTTPAAALTVTATSSNPAVVPVANIALGGSGAGRTVTVAGPFAQPGTSVVTLTATDAQGLTATRSFAVTVTNAAPTIAALASAPPRFAGDPYPFGIDDDTTPAASLVFTATSSDPNVVPASSITLSGTGKFRNVTVSNLPGTPGTSVITLTVTDAQGLTATESLPIAVTNAAPTIALLYSFSDPTAAVVGQPPGAVTSVFRVGDDSTPAAGLTFTATSSNLVAVPASSITLGGAGDERTVKVGPFPGTSGTSLITVTVTDAQGLSATYTYFVTVTNAAPTIFTILRFPNIPADAPPSTFFIGDDYTPAASLLFTATSSNEDVVPASSITLGGTGQQRTVSVGNLPRAPGTSLITLTVTDAQGATATYTYPVTVPNAAPTVAFRTGDPIAAPVGVRVFSFDVGDDFTPVGQLTFTVASSNPAVVPPSVLHSSGTGAIRSASIGFLPGTPGTSVVTFTVTDAQGLSASVSVPVTVPYPGPTLTAVPDQTLTAAGSTGALAFTVGDDFTPVGNLVVTATSSNPAAVSPANVALGGTGAGRTVTVAGPFAQPGTSVVTLTVTDGQGLTATRSFAVTVANAAPTITLLPNAFNVLPGTTPFSFDVGDDFTPAGSLTFTATSSDAAVVPVSSIELGGSGATRTAFVRNLPGTPGTSVITFTVTDAQGLSASRSFAVTVPTPPVVVPPVVVPPVVVPPVVVPPVVAPKRTHLFAVAADAGGSPEVQVFGADGKPRMRFLAFDARFAGGVRVATADFDGDGTDDIVVAAGPGGGPHVRVVSGATGAELASFFAFAPNFRGGVSVAAADFAGGGVPSIVVAAGPGGGPHVKLVALDGTVTQSFFAFAPNFDGGVNVAAADLDGDGRAEVVAAAGPGGGPHVKAFTFRSGGPVVTQSYFAFDAGFQGGVFVAAGTFGVAAAQGVGGAGEVRLPGGVKFSPYGADFTGGVRLGAFDLGDDGADEVLTAAGPGGGPHVRAFTAAGAAALSAVAFDKFDPTGYFIG